MLVILLSSITSILKIQKRSVMIGTVTPTDQILMKTHMLEAYLMGFALFLGLIIDRLHHFLRELATFRGSAGSLKKQAQSPQATLKEDKEHGTVSELRVLQDEIVELRQKLQKLTLDSEAMENEAKAVEAKTKALQKQAEGFLLKYDRLLEDNQNLQSQLSAYNNTSSSSDTKM